ncbi:MULTISPECIES: hypothetical protein [unclassified Azospirillum]|uniref:hypothetical protein n=1 Tax=unclassified Azospirillum TaxID=2630922 RepID=UPI0011B1F7F9|nr:MULTISPECIES: hypothetical protein [unclassified Azospirillum]
MNNQKFQAVLANAGSWASVIGLFIVLLQLGTPENDVQMKLWRVIFAAIMMVSCISVILVAYYRISFTLQKPISSEKKVTFATLQSAFYLILFAIFADGFFAAMYWRWWMGDLIYKIRHVIL